MRKALPLILLFSIFLVHLSSQHAPAASDDFYKGKRIRIIVGFVPGTFTDVRSRLFARHLPKWIPGQPRIIVQNMVGAGGLLAANHAFAGIEPDGLTILAFPVSTIMHAFLAPHEVKYDVRKVSVVWTADDNWLTVINPKSTQVRSAKELPRAPVRIAVGGTGATSTRSLRPKLAMELFGVDYTWVTGYGGSTALIAAHDRGEIHASEQPVSGFTPLLKEREKEGTMAVLWQTGLIGADGSFRRSPTALDIPTLDEILPDETKTGPIWEAFKALVVPLAFQNNVGVPPGVPADRVRILSRAFKSMTEDQVFQAEYRKAFEGESILAGDDADKIVKAGLKQLENLQEGIRHLRDSLKN